MPANKVTLCHPKFLEILMKYESLPNVCNVPGDSLTSKRFQVTSYFTRHEPVLRRRLLSLGVGGSFGDVKCIIIIIWVKPE